MTNSIISEGKTTAEAIEKGLKQLGVRKEKVDIKIIEEEKRSFFSILTPRVVKVEMTLKKPENKEERSKDINKQVVDIENYCNKAKKFLDQFIKELRNEELTYNISTENEFINIEFSGENLNYLIGYRGEVLNAIQTIISSIINKESEQKIKVSVDIKGYRDKREKALEDLAEKIAKTVIKTGKPITLEPMSAYERKIIHSKLQENSKVKTTSKGEEPFRKVVIELK